MVLQKIKRFIFRFLVYQIILLWSVTKFNNVEKHAGDFKSKLLINLNLFGIKGKELGEVLEDPSILFVYSLLEIISAVLGIFGSFYGHILSAFFFLLTNIIYFNPIFPEYGISLLNTRIELFYNIGILLSLLLLAYYPYEDSSKLNVHQVKNEEEDEEEIEETEQTAVSNSKKKKN
jgi:hypothetical protein